MRRGDDSGEKGEGMKAGLSMLLLVAAFAAPAYAGHGTIEETDEVIIVEYSGDAGDGQPAKKGDAPAPSRPVAPAQAGPGQAPDAANAAGVANPVSAAKVEGDSDRARPQRDEAAAAARRQAREEKRARRGRSSGGGSHDE
jgi:hypothetical protein